MRLVSVGFDEIRIHDHQIGPIDQPHLVAFGSPGVGLDREQGCDLVVGPFDRSGEKEVKESSISSILMVCKV